MDETQKDRIRAALAGIEGLLQEKQATNGDEDSRRRLVELANQIRSVGVNDAYIEQKAPEIVDYARWLYGDRPDEQCPYGSRAGLRTQIRSYCAAIEARLNRA